MGNSKSNRALTLQNLLFVEQGGLRLWLERLASPSSLPGHVARDHLLGIKHLGRPIWVLGFGSVAPQTPASPAGGPGDRQSCFLLETLVMGLLGS